MLTPLQETRESLGVNLEGAIVIVDEGHNLVDAVNAIHSATITRDQLATAKRALKTYFDQFSSRLAPGALPLAQPEMSARNGWPSGCFWGCM